MNAPTKRRPNRKPWKNNRRSKGKKYLDLLTAVVTFRQQGAKA